MSSTPTAAKTPTRPGVARDEVSNSSSFTTDAARMPNPERRRRDGWLGHRRRDGLLLRPASRQKRLYLEPDDIKLCEDSVDLGFVLHYRTSFLESIVEKSCLQIWSLTCLAQARFFAPL